ncbi:MAG: sugar porter family MFS transporter [Candidatus Gastranaerophilales bacterium]|nr:sugar porter family MFS transporter [Candidatus Gastranaerophilales bacterium]MDD3149529.1 sugar porter family MFS transporter [Candidatus Gastranaerophilales bacterium]
MNKNSKKFVAMSAIVAAFGGLLFGFDTAVIAGTTSALSKLFDLNAGSLGLTVSIALWGTIIGAMFAGLLGDKIGRRDSLKIMGFLFLVSALGCAFAWDWYSLVFFRFIGGLGVGGASVLAPMYISEIAPAQYRGRLVGLFQFNIVFGILVAYFSNYLIGLLNSGDLEWRIKFGIEALPALIFCTLLFTIPYSPRWLIKNGRYDEAKKVLSLIDKNNAESEYEEMVKSIEIDNNNKKAVLFCKKYSFPIFLAVSIAMFNQFSGINALLYYLNDIFAMAGFNKVSSDLQSVLIGGTNLLFTILAMSVIDKIGRKNLLLTGAIGTSLCLFGVAAIFLLNSYENLLIWLLVGYIAFFAFSQGAVIWVYISEVFPNIVRAKGQSLGSLTHWLMCAIISWSFPVMAETTGGYTFVFFGLMTVIQFFVVLFVYPETKNITLEELQKQLSEKKFNKFTDNELQPDNI